MLNYVWTSQDRGAILEFTETFLDRKGKIFTMVKDRRYSCARRPDQVPCKAGLHCSKCSFLEVIRVRFRAFREHFGRDPGPNEPLFFDPDQDQPVQVDMAQAIDQIEAAARTLKIDSEPVLNFLNLGSASRNKQEQSRSDAGSVSTRALPGSNPSRLQKREPSAEMAAKPVNRGRSGRGLFVVADCRTKGPSKREPQSSAISAWKRFVKEERTHSRLDVTKAEWTLLSKVAMMGEVRDSRDFIFILNTIRQARA